MKLIDAIKEKGDPYWIPDCSRTELPEFFKELGFKVGVEVGVSHGENMEHYAKAGLTMYGVDPWISYEDDVYRPISSLSKEVNQTIEDIHQLAIRRLSPYPNVTLIQKSSMDALADFPKRSLDFVYIDANHAFGYVAMDLMKWTDKVRRGGIVAGHDYFSTKGIRKVRGVGIAVDAFVKCSYIDNWYVLGRKERDEGEKFDRELSFMFFKNW